MKKIPKYITNDKYTILLRHEFALSRLYPPEGILAQESLPGVRIMDLKVWHKRVKKFRDKVGLDFYHLNLSHDPDLSRFMANFVLGSLPEDLISYLRILSRLQPIYKGILDKIISGEENSLSKNEIDFFIQTLNFEGFSTTMAGGEFYLVLFPIKKLLATGILREVYRWVDEIIKGRFSVGRCAWKVCNNIFIARSAGHQRKFCSDACKAKDYRERCKQKEMLSC